MKTTKNTKKSQQIKNKIYNGAKEQISILVASFSKFPVCVPQHTGFFRNMLHMDHLKHF